ncbi:MAG: metal ABC transporter ATP-binding protein [Halieaceae bacterium]|nr:metal ABC transporter ATP-binding protein [Halieaceae bacterium]
MSESAPALIELEAARLGYGNKTIVDGVNLKVNQGDFLAVVGPNGAGKTTLLRTILGILKPLAGRCERRARLGYSPQRSLLDPVYPFTALEVVAMGLMGSSFAPARDPLHDIRKLFETMRGGGPDRDEALAREEDALRACGMLEHRDRPFRDLSGGQKQRVLVARALVAEPEVLILDEPTNDLDLRGEHDVMEVVRSLHEAGRTVVMVSHMLHVVARYADRLAFVHQGLLEAGAAHEMLTPDRLAPLYNGMPVAVGVFDGHIGVAPAEAPSRSLEPPTEH